MQMEFYCESSNNCNCKSGDEERNCCAIGEAEARNSCHGSNSIKFDSERDRVRGGDCDCDCECVGQIGEPAIDNTDTTNNQRCCNSSSCSSSSCNKTENISNANSSSSSPNYSDWEDRVLHVERSAYEQGYQQAVTDVIREGTTFADGYETGFWKGYSLSVEINFIETICKMYLNLFTAEEIVTTDETETAEFKQSQQANQKQQSISERSKKRINHLLELISSYPLHSIEEEFDYQTKLEEIRSIFRSLNIGINYNLRQSNTTNPIGNSSGNYISESQFFTESDRETDITNHFIGSTDW